jgi:hypothetical protein
MAWMAKNDKINRDYSQMIIAIFMTLAVLFGGLVLLCLFVGRKYEMRHHVGELDEDENEELTLMNKPTDEYNSKEKP